MPAMNKIGAVVVLYQPTRQEYENIREYCQSIDELILIDNSGQSSELVMWDVFKNIEGCEIKYLLPHGNLGLCAGMNKGMQIACEDGCDWCYTNNPDSRFGNDLTGIYKKVLAEKNDPGIAILGPQFLYDRKKLKKREGVYDVEWLMMSGCLVNVEIFLQVGGFDERLFLDGLDVEFGLRLRKQGYRVLECREAVLIHRPAITKERKILWYTLKYGWDKPVRYYYQARADVFIDKHYKTCYAKADLLKRLMKILLLFGDKREYLKMYWQGILDARKGRWGIYQYEKSN